MAARELHGRLAAGLERDVGELRARRPLHDLDEGLVEVLGLRAAHLHVAGLGGGDEFRARLPRRVGAGPEDEFVEGERRDGGEILALPRDLGHERKEPLVGRAEDQAMRVALPRLAVHETFRARAAALERDDDGLGDEIVLLDDRLDRPGEDVGAAAGTRGHDEFHGLGRRPIRGEGGALHPDEARGQDRAEPVSPNMLHDSPLPSGVPMPGCVSWRTPTGASVQCRAARRAASRIAARVAPRLATPFGAIMFYSFTGKL